MGAPLGGSYDLILGSPLSKGGDFTHEANSDSRARFYDLSETLINRRTAKRMIMPAVSEDLISYNGDSHLMTIAPTGSGKGRSVIIPNLLKLQRSSDSNRP